MLVTIYPFQAFTQKACARVFQDIVCLWSTPSTVVLLRKDRISIGYYLTQLGSNKAADQSINAYGERKY